ncbi:hypothetical protein J3F84DRAFT_349099 [Trichoderma pleuroticola]
MKLVIIPNILPYAAVTLAHQQQILSGDVCSSALWVNEQPSPPFEEKELPGRGRGLIANKTLHRGDKIFAHTPILMLDGKIFGELETEEWLELEHAAVNNLPPKTKKKFSALYGSPVTDPVSDRIDTNAFVLELHGFTYYAVFPETARLNHDCRPNAAYFFDKETLTHYVHAITDIAPGTEITITYIDPHMSRENRLKKLSSLWGFHCSCSLCSLHSDLAHESDERLGQINTIRERLEDWESAPPQMALALISLYEQERMHASSSSAYWPGKLKISRQKDVDRLEIPKYVDWQLQEAII